MSLSSMLTKKSVSSGLATHRMEQQSRVAESLPLSVNLSPTCRPCIAHHWHIVCIFRALQNVMSDTADSTHMANSTCSQW